MSRTVLLRAVVPCALIASVSLIAAGAAAGADRSKRASAPLKQVSYVESDFKIAPSSVTLTKGTPTKITVTNRGKVQHTFTSKKLKIKLVLDPDEQAAATSKNKKAGTFTAMCTIHPSMTTKIKVK